MKKLVLLTALLMLTACQPNGNASEKDRKEAGKKAEEIVGKHEDKEKDDPAKMKESENNEESEKPVESNIPIIVEENLTAIGKVKEVNHESAYLVLETEKGEIRFDKYNHAIINSTHDRSIGPEKINLNDELSVSYMKVDDKIIANTIKNFSNGEGSSIFVEVKEKQEFEEKYQKMAYDALYNEGLKYRQKSGEFLIVYPIVVDRYEDENVLKLYTINNYSWFILCDNDELEAKSGGTGGYVAIEYAKSGTGLKFKEIHKLEAEGELTNESLKNW